MSFYDNKIDVNQILVSVNRNINVGFASLGLPELIGYGRIILIN